MCSKTVGKNVVILECVSDKFKTQELCKKTLVKNVLDSFR